MAKPSQGEPKYIIYQRQRWSNYQLNRDTAESIIWAKLHNQQIFLQGWTWYHTDNIIQRSLNYLKLLMDNLAMAAPAPWSIARSLIELREYSQEADRMYDRAITSLLKSHNPCPHMTTTRIRGLFNLADQLLQQYIYQLLNTAELDPSYGILSSTNSDEFSLARDLAAEFRPAITDDVVLNFLRNVSITNGQGKKHGQWLLQNFLQHWETKLKTFILHPDAGEVTYRQCLDLQVRAYLSCLLGDTEYYRPLAFKHHPVRSHSVHPLKAQHRILALVKRSLISVFSVYKH